MSASFSSTPTSSSNRSSWFRRSAGKGKQAYPDATSVISTPSSPSSPTSSNPSSRPPVPPLPSGHSRPRPSAPSRPSSRPPTSRKRHAQPDPWPSMDVPVPEQCLQNPILLRRILGHICPDPDSQHLREQRQSLLWIALTCRATAPTAILLLWRKLDNLLPLLRLLPSFTTKNGRSNFHGASNPHEWQSFDRHAAYVMEIVYEDIPNSLNIDPSVYLRLFLRNSSILPSLVRFVCPPTARPSESEILLYMQSPLRVLELGTFELGTLHSSDTSKMALTREAIISSLSDKPSQITRLVLVDQPFSILSEGLPLLHLTSLELRAMYGVMDATLLRRIGALPHLRSFTVDSGCFTGLNLSNIATRNGHGTMSSHFEREKAAGEGLFMQLTHLELERHPSLPSASIALFLQLIGSTALRSLILGVRRVRGRGPNRGGRGRGAIPDEAGEAHGDPLQTIARRWPRLRTLHLEVDHSLAAITHFLHRLPNLRDLKLSGFLHLAESESDVDWDICAALTHVAELQRLSLRCCTSTTDAPLQFDVHAITRLAAMCPHLQFLDIAVSGSTLPSFSSMPTVFHNLGAIIVHHSEPIANVVVLARHLDRLFPRLSAVRYEDAETEVGKEGGIEREEGTQVEVAAAWAHVQELVFAFQDVRRGREILEISYDSS
ncbi:hypothetical protein C8R47DRAFT_1221150 [Mycena vitilis]|nr:hypothetical protein C8R47DRAFT_1221150 [Mycena vitilis]